MDRNLDCANRSWRGIGRASQCIVALIVVVCAVMLGCSAPPTEESPSSTDRPVTTQNQPKSPVAPQVSSSPTSQIEIEQSQLPPSHPSRRSGPLLSELVQGINQPRVRPQLDDRKLASAGLRRIDSKHLTLITDMRQGGEIDELPKWFDQAVPQWAKYFQLPVEQLETWHVQGYLMKDQQHFEPLALLPDDRTVINGFATADELWLNDQSSPYYRRHLLLHEGTHAFMVAHLKRWSPGWYIEGMAEYFGTHRIVDGQLHMRIMPGTSREVFLLGRIEHIQRDTGEGTIRTIEQVTAINNLRELQTDEYAWSWALVWLLDRHPRYQQRFRKLHRLAHAAEFQQAFLNEFIDDGKILQTDWIAFASTIDYGYDLKRMLIEFQSADREPTATTPIRVAVRADRGWQSTGVQLRQGSKYRISAKGRYQINDQPKIWWCEPNGVTIQYNQGQPLGMLQAALLSTDSDGQPDPVSFWRREPIGLETELKPQRSGVLYLRINDSGGDLHNNKGTLDVTIEMVDTIEVVD